MIFKLGDKHLSKSFGWKLQNILNHMFQSYYDLFKLIDSYKVSDTYKNQNSSLGHILIT